MSSLKDKASRIVFTPKEPEAESDAPTNAEAQHKTKTAPGAMMQFANDRRSELVQENEDLKKRVEGVAVVEQRLAESLDELRQWEGVKGARMIDPAEIRRSKFANRHITSFQDAEFLTLRAEIASAGGNVQPIKVRPVTPVAGSPVKYEIIYGHRRHEACRLESLEVFAIVDNLDDQSLFIEMDRENRARKSLTPYEQGVMYKNAIAHGLFASNKKMSAAIGVDLGAIGKAISLASLPGEVIDAFASPLDLQYRWAKPLADAVAADKARMFERAKQIQTITPRLGASQTFQALMGLVQQGGGTGSTPTITVEQGSRQAVIRASKTGQTQVSFNEGLTASSCEELAAFIKQLLAR